MNRNLAIRFSKAGGSGNRMVYILSPMALPQHWIDSAATRFDMTLFVITGMDWDNDLTPWPAPGQPPGEPPFEGHASEFLKRLTDTVIPACDARINLAADARPRRQLVGVSLSGLFTLWQWLQSPLFADICCISGSFWYEGFTDWMLTLDKIDKSGSAYFSLGDRESRSPVKAFSTVAAETDTVIKILRKHDIDVTFRSVPGNHYQHGIERLDMALGWLQSLHADD